MKFYRPFLERLAKFTDIRNKVVADLGAWNGQFTRHFSEKAKLVIAVEPSIEAFRTLTKDLPENVIPINMAIGRRTEKRELKIYDRTYQNTLFNNKDKIFEPISKRKVLTVSFDDLMAHLGIKEVDFVKVNIEGAEEEFVESLFNVLPKKMIIEEHTKTKSTNLKNLFNLLEIKGYKVVDYIKSDIYAEQIRNTG